MGHSTRGPARRGAGPVPRTARCHQRSRAAFQVCVTATSTPRCCPVPATPLTSVQVSFFHSSPSRVGTTVPTPNSKEDTKGDKPAPRLFPVGSPVPEGTGDCTHPQCSSQRCPPLAKAAQVPQSHRNQEPVPGCDLKKPTYNLCVNKPNSLIAGAEGNNHYEIRTKRHLAGRSVCFCVSENRVPSRAAPVLLSARARARTPPAPGTERNADTHSASPATKALHRPARKRRGRRISFRAHAAACTPRPGSACSRSRDSTQKHSGDQKVWLANGLEPRGEAPLKAACQSRSEGPALCCMALGTAGLAPPPHPKRGKSTEPQTWRPHASRTSL